MPTWIRLQAVPLVFRSSVLRATLHSKWREINEYLRIREDRPEAGGWERVGKVNLDALLDQDIL